MNDFFGHFNGTEFTFNNYRNFGEKNRYHLSFSGELYNTDEIIPYVINYDSFLSDPSTENIIYHLFLSFGADFPLKLNGNFAIAIADSVESTLYIIRDHIGLSRIYYSQAGRELFFSASIRTLLRQYPLTDSTPDINAVNHFFTYRYIPSEMTAFRNIKRLNPGSILIYKKNSGLESRRYWKPPCLEPHAKKHEEEIAGELDLLLRNSISRRLDGNDYGYALLSGGLDSSLNVAMMKSLGTKNIKTFTIGFADRKYDETGYADIVVNHFGTEHHYLKINPDTDIFDDIGKIFEEPNGDPSVFPSYQLAKLVSPLCSNVICGDGADGLFLGLKTHRMLSNYLSIYPYLKHLSPVLSFLSGYITDSFRWKMLFQGLDPEQFFLRKRIYFTLSDRKKLLSKNAINELGSDIVNPERYGSELFSSYQGSVLGKSGYFTYCSNPDDILTKMGRIMEHHGVRIRAPFLDKDVVDFCFGKISAGLKIKDGISKYILKKTARKYLPPDLPIDRKRGFNPPVSGWLREEWHDYVAGTILDSESEYINRDYAEKLIMKHKKNYFDESRRIFPLFMFRLWENSFPP